MSLTGYLLTWKTDRDEPLSQHPMLSDILREFNMHQQNPDHAARLLQGQEATGSAEARDEIAAGAERASRRWPRTTFTLRERSADASESWTFYRNGKSYSAKGDPPLYSQEEMEARGELAPNHQEDTVDKAAASRCSSRSSKQDYNQSAEARSAE